MTVNQVEPKAKADKKSHQRCRDLHVIIYTKYFLYHCCLGGYEPVKITFQIFVLANLRFCQKSTRENRPEEIEKLKNDSKWYGNLILET